MGEPAQVYYEIADARLSEIVFGRLEQIQSAVGGLVAELRNKPADKSAQLQEESKFLSTKIKLELVQ
jgi:hypothetical protein